MIKFWEDAAKHAVSDLLLKRSNLTLEVIKNLIRDNIEKFPVTVADQEYVPNIYEISIPSHELKSITGILPVLKNALQVSLNKFITDNGYKTTSSVELIFITAENDDDGISVRGITGNNIFIQASLINKETGTIYQISTNSMKIGRDDENDLVVEEATVSKRHCLIKFEEGKWVIIDSGAKNKVLVNFLPIEKSELCNDDLIQVGNTCFIFKNVRA